MQLLAKAAAIAAGTLFMATSASAAIVCNDEGDCWHTKQHAHFKPEFGLHVYPDNWKWSGHDHYRWREHGGRGYWRNGVWITF